MRRHIPSTTAMLCFEAAAKSESFIRAAEEINISQSAVSRQIQILEAYMGQTLFTRIKQRVILTSAGKSLLMNLSPLLEELEATILKTKSHDSSMHTLNIGVYPTLGSRWLMPIIMSPDIRDSNQNLNMITYLQNSEIDPSLVDLAIVQGDPPWNGYRADWLMGEKLIVVGNPENFPEKISDPYELLEMRILQHSTRPLSWNIWFDCLNLPLKKKIIGPIFNQFGMLIDAVKAGHGIAIIPEILITRELEERSIVKVHDFEASTQSAYYLLVPEAKTGIPRIEKMRKWFLTVPMTQLDQRSL